MTKVGIGVITYNRLNLAVRVVEKIRNLTTVPFDLVVADDGSADGTSDVLRSKHEKVVTGINRGVAWNKNRALFYLASNGCDVIVLLEDDAFPIESGWQDDWISGAIKHGHVNLAGSWFTDKFESGSGTPHDPFISPAVTAQCTAFSSEALRYVGYFDSRFLRYGYEHAEHSERLVRGGYGGRTIGDPSCPEFRFFLIGGKIHVEAPPTTAQAGDLEKNFEIYKRIRTEPLYRWPWSSEEQMQIFRDEQNSAR